MDKKNLKGYVTPSVLVVQLGQCQMLANSGGDEGEATRQWRNTGLDEDDEW